MALRFLGLTLSFGPSPSRLTDAECRKIQSANGHDDRSLGWVRRDCSRTAPVLNHADEAFRARCSADGHDDWSLAKARRHY